VSRSRHWSGRRGPDCAASGIPRDARRAGAPRRTRFRAGKRHVNPFLHLSLHLAVAEQLAIDQPPGIRAQFERLRAAKGSEHAALHAVLECLGEVIWQSQRTNAPPDGALYLECLTRAR
jgi:hypothetical protein